MVLPLLAISVSPGPAPGKPRWHRPVRALAWIEAAILTLYGLVLTSAGLLVQTGVITTSASSDHRALAWHAYLWDPWFGVWGLLVTVALLRPRQRRGCAGLCG